MPDETNNDDQKQPQSDEQSESQDSATAGETSEPTAAPDSASADAGKQPPANGSSTEPDQDTVKNLASALAGDLINSLGKAAKRLRPNDHILIQKVAFNAIKFRLSNPNLEDSKTVRKANQIAAQLRNVRAFGRKVAADAFWETVENVLTRLSAFALGKVL